VSRCGRGPFRRWSWRAAKIVGDLGFEVGLITLEGEQVFGLVGDDLFGDVDLTAHGINGDQRPFQLPGLGEMIK